MTKKSNSNDDRSNQLNPSNEQFQYNNKTIAKAIIKIIAFVLLVGYIIWISFAFVAFLEY